MGFDAARAVSALDWNFAPHVEASGTIPEPTQAELETFLDALAKLSELDSGADGEAPDPAEVTEAISKALADDGLVKQFWPKVLDALEPICKGQPTREQIEALPARLRFAFFDWLTEEFTNPSKPNAAIRR